MQEKETMRNGEPFPVGHPLRDMEPLGEDCISDVSADKKDELAAFYNYEEPLDTLVDPKDLV